MGFFDDLDELIRSSGNASTAAQVLAAMGTPSVSIAVLDSGEISSQYFSTVGNDTNTIFQACSIFKAITALAVMTLVEQSHLTLDRTLKDLLPEDVLGLLLEGESHASRALIKAMNFQQLMSHTSGLSVSSFPGYPLKDGESTVPSLKDIVGRTNSVTTLRLRLTGLPGHGFLYSGGGIIVLQIIMETVTGKDLSTLMPGALQEYPSILSTERCAGLWTTPTDFLRAVLAVQDSLEGEGGVLNQATAKEMLTEVDSSMRLSWFLPCDQGTLFQHTGSNDPGYICLATGFVDLKGNEQGAKIPKRSGISVMTNSFLGLDAAYKMYMAVSYLKRWPSIVKSRIARIPFPLPGQDSWAARQRWLGSWTDEGKKHRYTATVDISEGPCPAFDHFEPLRLYPTAGPDSTFSGSRAFCEFALEDMDMVVRLEGEKGQEVLEICDGRADNVTALTRVSPGDDERQASPVS